MIPIKTPEEIEIMAEGGKILANVMKETEKKVVPGITTEELNRLAESLILKFGGTCSFKGYNVPDDSSPNRVYPACLCTSINEVIVHGVPSGVVLKEGDIVSLDLGVFYKGFHTDMAVTVPVGKISEESQKLIDVTKNALQIAINEIGPGNKIGDISKVIQKYVESQDLNVVRELCGHGTGKNLHEEPEVLNSVSFNKLTNDKVKYFGDANIELKEGMVLCPEPMVAAGEWMIKRSKDGFGWETKDKSLSAHFEHTVAVTKEGFQILTKI